LFMPLFTLLAFPLEGVSSLESDPKLKIFQQKIWTPFATRLLDGVQKPAAGSFGTSRRPNLSTIVVVSPWTRLGLERGLVDGHAKNMCFLSEASKCTAKVGRK
jgi:hypothetical protein